MNLPRTLALICAPLLIASAASSQGNPNGATQGGTLNSVLIEDFESYYLPFGGAELTNTTSLDETTIVNGQGPGLVEDGCTYSCGSGSLQWNGQGYYGMPSQNFLATTNDGVLTLSYSPAVSLVSFDLYTFQGYPDSTIVRVYNPAGGLIYTSGTISVPGPVAVPFSYSAAAIGTVTVDSQSYSWSTMIDDHEYGGSGPSLAKTGTCPGPMGLQVSGCTPNSPVAVLYGPAGSFTKNGNPCNGLQLGISNPTLAAILGANGAGNASLNFNAPPGACGRTVQAVDVASCSPTNTIVL